MLYYLRSKQRQSQSRSNGQEPSIPVEPRRPENHQESHDYLELVNAPPHHDRIIPDYLIPVAPRCPENREESLDYLEPVNQSRQLERVPAPVDIPSEYLTLQKPAINNQDDVPLYQAPVVHGELSEYAEYERLNLYETIDF